MGIYKSRNVPLIYGIVLVVLVVILQYESVQGNPQIRTSSDDAWFNERVKENADWFKKTQEEHEQKRSQMNKRWKENSDQSLKIFWIIGGIMLGIFVLVVVTCVCCLCIPACCLAKVIQNHRSRRMYQQPIVQPQPLQPIPGTYPSQQVKPMTGYPYDQNQMAFQQQPLMPGQQPQNLSYNVYPPMPAPPISSENNTAQLPYNPYLGGGVNHPTSFQQQPQPPGPGYPSNPPPYLPTQ